MQLFLYYRLPRGLRRVDIENEIARNIINFILEFNGKF
jgi:hypothetical protein